MARRPPQRRGILTQPLAGEPTSPGFADEQKRIIAGTLDVMRIVNAATSPTGGLSAPTSSPTRCSLSEALTGWLRAELQTTQSWCSPATGLAPAKTATPTRTGSTRSTSRCPVRDAFKALLGRLASSMPSGSSSGGFSWWDYRMMAFRRNVRLRIDHLLVSPLAEKMRHLRGGQDPRKLRRRRIRPRGDRRVYLSHGHRRPAGHAPRALPDPRRAAGPAHGVWPAAPAKMQLPPGTGGRAPICLGFPFVIDGGIPRRQGIQRTRAAAVPGCAGRKPA